MVRKCIGQRKIICGNDLAVMFGQEALRYAAGIFALVQRADVETD